MDFRGERSGPTTQEPLAHSRAFRSASKEIAEKCNKWLTPSTDGYDLHAIDLAKYSSKFGIGERIAAERTSQNWRTFSVLRRKRNN